MSILQSLLPYLLPMVLVGLNEIIAHNPNLESSSLLGLIISTIVAAVKAAIGMNPVPQQLK